ncbi:DUF3152 domain-containing protein [Streptomyces sp. NBC_01217]|uniref:DUF3152 domain-containing protein n=1 Tax=Streptomyces sp. NBC_01217 TaxID=2903779 RepID=UPI002E111B92|nr:DUF3152 domain-containing protein [Streptomyces sp. NBC_01217]
MAADERGRRARGRAPRARGAARRARRRRTRIRVASAVLVPAALLCGALVWWPWEGGEGASALARTRLAVRTPAPPSAPVSPVSSASSASSASPSAGSGPEKEKERKEDRTRTGSLPRHGSGKFRTAAPPHADTQGTGTVHRYRVEVEEGSGLATGPAAAEVAGVFGNPRGWTRTGRDAFRQVGSGPAGLVIRIATPDTVDRLCGAYGLRTRGEVNCRVGATVVVNLKRWLQGSPQFDGPLAEYRALIINHEVGHWLGHGHETCPGPGRPAPAMMQQIDGLKGCVANAWPYTADGTYISGPSVP